jgi:hypothetical protein
MNSPAQRRLDALADEVAQKHLAGTITKSYMDRVEAEAAELRTAIATGKAALRYAGSASPAEWGMADTNPGDADNNIAFKGFGPGMGNQIRPTSMYAIDKTQVDALRQAALQGTPFKIQVGSKRIEHGAFGGQIRTKAAVTEGGLTPNLLPPIQQLGPMGWWGLPYELTRVANFLPNVAMDGPGIAYFRHGSNAAEAAYTAEGAAKPDLTPAITETYVKPAKVAGRINLTHELVQDAGDAFTHNLIADLARSLYNAESNLLLNGTTATNGFNGINQVTGALTRAYTSATDIDALGCLSHAFVDLRQEFFEPDLVFINPQTLGSIRRLRDLNNRLQLDLLAGARAIDQTNEQETLWGVKCVQTTQQTAGTAAVLSVSSGAAVVYIREALVTFFDPYSQISNNIYQYVAESRLALATPRPGAINIVTGLPTS